jgi:hypothetical protein
MYCEVKDIRRAILYFMNASPLEDFAELGHSQSRPVLYELFAKRVPIKPYYTTQDVCFSNIFQIQLRLIHI